jgi:hypothetical protein
VITIPRSLFFRSAVCYYGDDSIPAEALYSAIQNGPLEYSGTSVAMYQIMTKSVPALLKIFSRNWSRHTKDFCEWAYGSELHSKEISDLLISLKTYIQKISNYGLEVDLPMSLWEISDPFQQGADEKALAMIVREYTAPSIRKLLFDFRGDEDQVTKIFKHHINLLLQVILKAEKLGDVSDYLIKYGLDLKPRNLILAEKWIYIDLFPVLTPNEMKGYVANAPLKAFMKRFDTRYYIFDLLFRYYKIAPEINDTLIGIAKTEMENNLGMKSGQYIDFLSRYMDAYLAKWGHMPPDKDWQHPFLD